MKSRRVTIKETRKPSVLPSKVRGVIGLARSHKYGVSDSERAFNFRIGLHQAILKSRQHLHSATYSQVFSAIEDAAAAEHRRFARYPVDDEYVRLLIEIKPLSIDQEVAWLGARLGVQTEALALHVELRSLLNGHVLQENWAAAEICLNEHEQIFGKSLWSVALRIAVVQETGGDDARKEYVAALRKKTRKGILPFYAFLVSQRAAATTSIGWYLDDASRRLDRAKPGDILDYLRFKLLGEWPKSIEKAGSILRIEQNHSIVDQYETLLAFLQRSGSSIAGGIFVREASRVATQFERTGDERVSKILRALTGIPDEDIRARTYDQPLVPYTKNSPVEAFLRLRSKADNMQAILAAAIMRASPEKAGSHRGARRGTYAIRLINGISLALSRRSHSFRSVSPSSLDWSRKFSHVFGGIEIGAAARHVIDAFYHPDIGSARSQLRLAALSTVDDGLLDLLTEPAHRVYSALGKKFAGTASLEFANVARSDPSERKSALSADAQAVAFSLQSVFGVAGNPTGSRAADISVRSDIGHRLAAQIHISVSAKQGDIWSAAKVAADEFVVWGVNPASLPITEIFDGVDWNDLKDCASHVELSNAMSALPQKKQDERTRSYRRFALEHCMRSLGIDRPSDLRHANPGVEAKHLVHFLSRVCTQAMLDMLPSMRGSRHVLEERRAICGYLVALDPSKAAEYEDEVLTISRELAVLDGLETFDGSRVHVDMDALGQIMKRDLQEGFSRYASLLEGDSGTSENFDQVLKDILRRDIQARLLITIPVSEADELLISMIWRARDRFLFNVPHGLDSYLSKRIRHGSIVGFIRSPGEKEGVIAQRSAAGVYRAEGSWADHVDDPLQRQRLVDLLSSFSRSIDDRLILLRDVLLHVRSEDKQRGMLDARLSPPEYHLIRSVASKDRSLDAFVDTILLSLRGLLGPSLLEVRDYIGRDILRFVSEQFESLRGRARDILVNPEERAAFDSAAGRASVAMQSAVQSAAMWFDPVDMKPHTFTLEDVIDIAIASVAAISKGFAPKLNIEKTASFGISEQALPILMDVLFPALGNVAEHSNCGESPEVRICLEHRQREGILRLRIENQFTRTLPTQELQSDLAARRKELDESSESYRVRQDKGSGLAKIKSTARAAGSSHFEFGATEELFYVSVDLPFSPDRLVEL